MPLVTDLRLAALGQCTGGCGLLLQSGWEIGLRSRAARTVGLWGVERKGGGGGGVGAAGVQVKQCVAQGQPQNPPTRPPMWTSAPVLALGPFNLVCPGEATQSGQRKRTPEQQSGERLRPVSLPEPKLPLPRGSGPESARTPCPLPPDSLCMVQDLASARFLVACFCFAMMCGFCDPRSSVKQGGS